MKEILDKISQKLSDPLPGFSAQSKMAPEVRKSAEISSGRRKAAVLVLLFPEKDQLCLAFIQRPVYNGPHSGQISFPGGLKEKTDHDLMETAKRESKEETGIRSSDIRILGRLSELTIPVSNYIVQPFVGCLDYPPDFKPDPREVDHMISIPLIHLLDRKNIHREETNYRGVTFTYPYYLYKEYKIWGATAMILSEFLAIIEEVVPSLSAPED